MKAKTEEVVNGVQFYSLTLTGNYSFLETNSGKRMYVEAKCKCGVIKSYPLRYLKTGNTKSCGCERRDNLLKSKITHHLSKHPLYSVYQDIQRRCYNENCKSFKDYGGRGIICLWKDVASFIDWGMANGYKKGLEIDRENNNGNYEESNCRFVTRAIGNTNTRRVIKLTAFGETKTVAEWTRDNRCSISKHALADRVHSGIWEVVEAITTPSNGKKLELSRNSKSSVKIKAFGEEKSIIGWSEDERCKIGYSGLKARIQKGWSAEKALITPLNK